MSLFLPILPALLFVVLGSIVCYWNLRKIDQFLADHPDPAKPGAPSSSAESQIRLPH